MAGPEQLTISTSFISHLRKSSRLTCPMVGCEDHYLATDNGIREHFKSKHSEFIRGKDISSLIRDVKEGRIPGSQGVDPSSTRDPGGGNPSEAQGMTDEAGPSSKRRKSPATSQVEQSRPQSNSPPRRSRARHDPDFTPRGPQQGKLWHPEEDSTSSPYRTKQRSFKPLKHMATSKAADAPKEDSESLRLIKQPETRPISQEQLVAEVKGIYAGLMMVESKCIEVDNAQSSQNDTKLNNEQWQALIALHRTLLHEHYDFFLASQHPSASLALKRLASKYSMPARMWRHGIQSFLELLRRHLPGSLEHMLTFIYLAYSMMALLYETIPAFEDIWIEYLGDLGRYRMAIEDKDIKDKEVWTSVSRHWYSKAASKAPTTGRLYHYLAILARPNALQQLFYYTKSLCVPIPFGSAKESIMTLFNPILEVRNYQHNRLIPIDVAFVKTHGILFSHKQLDNFRQYASEFLRSLDNHIDRIAKHWMEAGYYIAIANCCALLSYSKKDNVIMRSIHSESDEKQDQGVGGSGTDGLKPSRDFEDALYLAMGTHEVVFKRWDDVNVLPYTHVVMVFMCYLVHLPNAFHHLEHLFPWKLLSLMLNGLLAGYNNYDRIHSIEFPRESNDPPCPLPEDFALEGLLFVDQYYPSDWFSDDKIDDDEKYFEMASMTAVRKERILWLGYKIAQSERGLTYDKETNRFSVLSKYEKVIDESFEDLNMNI
ncbi:hypothetical protein F5B22DRAFT_587878 [Xylaria bambusicola]|uniref:uncharacterized protein n=1 Tax=Xylaria bambusicola TaxID=326684 RepID=UPI002008C659|nr:uncharacterized protein F5B22DRAFT_587878 [Xylaria bambusicola]KAI0525819.1 hypothetical protein F5B22DRAFT_587878 [Xylaria bambusicola]